MRHSLFANNMTKETKKIMKEEIEQVIASAYKKEHEEKWKDIYVTDHTPKNKRYFTLNKNED